MVSLLLILNESMVVWTKVLSTFEHKITVDPSKSICFSSMIHFTFFKPHWPEIKYIHENIKQLNHESTFTGMKIVYQLCISWHFKATILCFISGGTLVSCLSFLPFTKMGVILNSRRMPPFLCHHSYAILYVEFILHNIYTPSVFCYDKHKKNFDIQFSLKRHKTV